MSLIHNSIIPNKNAVAVEDALWQVFNNSRVTEMMLLAGGLSGSSVYKIILDNQPYLLKLNPPEDTSISFQSALELAASAGIAPRLYHDDKLQGIALVIL